MAKLNEGVAVVTGGGSGMGRAISLRFAASGTRVVVAGRTAAGLEETVSLIRSAGGEAAACVADVAVESDMRRMVELAVSRYGRLDFAANVAGVAQIPKLMHLFTLDEFEEDHAVNSRGVFLSMKHEISAMLEAGSGSIVNVTSCAGMAGFAFYSAYTAAKHAAIGLTRAAALEYADKGIRINSVAPGAIATPMLLDNPPEVLDPMRDTIPMRRFGTPEDIAAATVWLCSDDAAYVTGQVLPVEGAYSTSAITIVSSSDFVRRT